MSDNALAWLRAQLDDDERVAREALGDSWLALTMYPDRGEIACRPNGEHVGRTPDHETAEHIARWDPARVLLAEIDAKRRILDRCARALVAPSDPWNDGAYGFAELVIHELAQPYTDRDGFPQEWR